MKKALLVLAIFILLSYAYHPLMARIGVDSSVPSLHGLSGTSTISLLFVGDIMPSRWVAKQMSAEGYDFPFAETREMTRDADFTMGNLESAVTPGREIHSGEMSFRTDPEFLPSLRDAGFDAVDLANNHTPNFGQLGLTDTMRYLRENQIDYVGAGTTSSAYEPLYRDVNGLHIAIIAQNDTSPIPDTYCANMTRVGTACFDLAKLRQSIEGARLHADFIVFMMHAGTEYASTSNALQQQYAHAAIDTGADLVIGHHPHTIQEREQYRGKWIYYSLGNYIFDQDWSRNTRLGLALIVDVGLTTHEVERRKHVIVRVDHYAQPRFATEAEISDMFEFLELP